MLANVPWVAIGARDRNTIVQRYRDYRAGLLPANYPLPVPLNVALIVREAHETTQDNAKPRLAGS